MFKRRVPLGRLAVIREVFWPSMGWKRATHYVKHRILRLSGTTEHIACGLATGAAVSFSPLLGTHFIQAVLFSLLFRGNVIASLIATFVGNPWTFPFIWLAGYTLGVWMFGLLGFSEFAALPEQMNFSMLWEMAVNEPLHLLLPWLLGGYTAAMISWPLFFLIFYHLVKAAHRAKVRARARRMKQRSIERHKFQPPPKKGPRS